MVCDKEDCISTLSTETHFLKPPADPLCQPWAVDTIVVNDVGSFKRGCVRGAPAWHKLENR